MGKTPDACHGQNPRRLSWAKPQTLVMGKTPDVCHGQNPRRWAKNPRRLSKKQNPRRLSWAKPQMSWAKPQIMGKTPDHNIMGKKPQIMGKTPDHPRLCHGQNPRRLSWAKPQTLVMGKTPDACHGQNPRRLSWAKPQTFVMGKTPDACHGQNPRRLSWAGKASCGHNSYGRHIPNRIDARVTIRYPNESAKFMPFGFAAALMPSPLAPTLPNPYDHEHESSVTYSEKGNNSSIRTEVSRTDSLFNELFSLVGIRKRAESNGYEEGVPNIPIRESRKSSRVSNVSSGTKKKPIKGVPRHKVRVLEILGEGCFGQVWKCDAMDLGVKGRRTVAVKTLKESAGQAEQNDLMQELKVLKSLSYHPNVVSLLGCCTEKEPIFVILEYMVGGKLQSYLRSSRANGHPYDNLHGVSSSLTPRDLTIFALQTAKGMDFLSQNGIIHRDLAARNVLVGDNKICKVADFGFARDVANNHIYERKSDGRLPISQMLWSFGVLLWEIVTLGSTPYPGRSAVDVMKRVKDGYRLEKPDHCKREVSKLIGFEKALRSTECIKCQIFDICVLDVVRDLQYNVLLLGRRPETQTEFLRACQVPRSSYFNRGRLYPIREFPRPQLL
ncbi:Tyrosine kinase receptor Cad96Ca [Armadillidium vulgare]|nr:Tyrosine kinase receptor Cad96Ca [Armadillidium vulgare]